MTRGRPAKPALTDEEYHFVRQLLDDGAARATRAEGATRDHARRPRGTGWRAAADALSRRRGALDVLEPRLREARSVSARWLQTAVNARLSRGESDNVGKIDARREWSPTWESRAVRGERRPEPHQDAGK